jgi:hypothetical protein
MSMRYLCLALTLLVAACQSSVTVTDPRLAAASPEEARVRAVRHFEADAEAVRSLGEGAGPILIRLAEGEGEASATRIRATVAMRHQSSDAVKASLVELATTADIAAVRRSSLDSLARAFGSRDPGLVIATATSLASHPDESVRRAASAAEVRARVSGAFRRRP